MSYLDVLPPHLLLQLMCVALKYTSLVLKFLFTVPREKRRKLARIKKVLLHVRWSLRAPSVTFRWYECVFSPAARSIVSSLTTFFRASSTFSCMTSLTVSTFFVTDANLSTSERLSYFWQVFWSMLPQTLSKDLSLAVATLSPAFA